MKKILIWSIILLLTALPIAGCAARSIETITSGNQSDSGSAVQPIGSKGNGDETPDTPVSSDGSIGISPGDKGKGEEGSVPSSGQASPSNPGGASAGTTSSGIKYEVIDIEQVPAQLKEKTESLKMEKCFAKLSSQNETYIYVSGGEKPTGGYSVKLIKAEDIGSDKLKITVAFEEPPKDAMVTEVISYPSLAIKISASDVSVEVVDAENNKVEEKDI